MALRLLTTVGAGGAVRASPVYRLRVLGLISGGFRSIGVSTYWIAGIPR
jgi:hypothetical protein